MYSFKFKLIFLLISVHTVFVCGKGISASSSESQATAAASEAKAIKTSYNWYPNTHQSSYTSGNGAGSTNHGEYQQYSSVYPTHQAASRDSYASAAGSSDLGYPEDSSSVGSSNIGHGYYPPQSGTSHGPSVMYHYTLYPGRDHSTYGSGGGLGHTRTSYEHDELSG